MADAITRSFSTDEDTNNLLEEMRWMDRKSLSEFIRWLITEEAKRREVQPVAN